MTSAYEYNVVVRKTEIDGDTVFRATVREFPHVLVIGETYNEVYEVAIETIEGLLEAAQEDGKQIPAPMEEDEEFTGRVTLRMPPWLHRSINLISQHHNSSLNQWIVTTLAFAAGNPQAYFAEPSMASMHHQAVIPAPRSVQVHPDFNFVVVDFAAAQQMGPVTSYPVPYGNRAVEGLHS